MFTKEFKRQRCSGWNEGSSIGEVARELEVNPNVLHRWRREVPSKVQATCFRVTETSAELKGA